MSGGNPALDARGIFRFSLWAESILPKAYESGLKPREFWAMSAQEVLDYVEAQARNESREWDRTAWLAAIVLNAFRAKGSKPIKADDLLGRPMTDSKKKSQVRKTAEEREADRRYLKRLGRDLEGEKVKR